jgi:hypothetical protein|tara:strand:- start:308 stop:541 length:234 start_codon:yes stop_codon:yes gene_type:complete
MAKERTIKFTIRQDGTIFEEVINGENAECIKLTEEIENRLGEVQSRKLKPEAYLAQPVDNFWKQTTDVTLHNNQNTD